MKRQWIKHQLMKHTRIFHWTNGPEHLDTHSFGTQPPEFGQRCWIATDCSAIVKPKGFNKFMVIQRGVGDDLRFRRSAFALLDTSIVMNQHWIAYQFIAELFAAISTCPNTPKVQCSGFLNFLIGRFVCITHKMISHQTTASQVLFVAWRLGTFPQRHDIPKNAL